MSDVKDKNVLPNITTQHQLDTLSRQLMSNLERIYARFSNDYHQYSNAGKILTGTVHFCLNSLTKTIDALKTHRNKASSTSDNPQITELEFQREKWFVYNIHLAIEILDEAPNEAMKDQSTVLENPVNTAISALNFLRQTSDLLLQNVTHNTLDDEKFKRLSYDINFMIFHRNSMHDKQLSNDGKFATFYKSLRDTLIHIAHLALVKIGMLARNAGVDFEGAANDIDKMAPGVAIINEQFKRLKAKTARKSNEEVEEQRANDPDIRHLQATLFTANKYRTISEKIAELKQASSSTPTSKKT